MSTDRLSHQQLFVFPSYTRLVAVLFSIHLVESTTASLIVNLAFTVFGSNLGLLKRRAYIDPPTFQSLNLAGRRRLVTHARGRGAGLAVLCSPSDSGVLTVLKDTCRICSAPGEPGQPLFYPCKCSGTIRYIHQDWSVQPYPLLFCTHFMYPIA